MKFRDGMWLVRQDKSVQYAEDIYTITPRADGKALNLLCPTRRINSRGDTLNLATLNVEIEAQFDGVVSLEVTHYAGARRLGPNFDLYPDGKPESAASITKSEAVGTTITSGKLSATVGPDPHAFDIRFHDTETGAEVTSLLNRSVGLAYSPALSSPKQVEDLGSNGIKHYIFTQTQLGVGESIHGLGERFGAWNRVGQNIEVWNEDGGTSSEQAYKNVSFWLSSAGYGIFVDTPGKVDLEIGSERCCRVQMAVESQRLKWYIIYGPDPKTILTKYARLTGFPAPVPSWSFGLWLSTSFTTSYSEATVSHFLTEMKQRAIPVEVFHFDCFWLRAFHWCDFVFDTDQFPDPAGQIKRLKEAGLVNKISVWTNPYVGQASPVFQFAADNGYLVRRTNGDVWQWDLWQTGMALVDFTNPAAVKWYESCIEKLCDIGVDCIKTDFGERIPTKGVKWFDESVDNERMHNWYAFIYNKTVYQTLQHRYGEREAVLFARTACAGTQRFPLCWGGDSESTPPALAETIRAGLSLGLAAFSSWSCDIGGFEGSPPPWLYKRWVAFGLLCSHSRLHGSNSYRVPWFIDSDSQEPENATEVLRGWVQLKRRLMPYLYAQAVESWANGWPISLRAMGLEFPRDPTSWMCDRQFMVGSQILAAPVFTESGEVQFYLPEGRWTSFWTGEVVVGPGWRKEVHGFLTLPLYVREGTVLVLGQEKGVGGFGYDWLSGGGEVRLYGVKPGDRAALVDKEGKGVGEMVVGTDGNVSLEYLRGEWSVVEVS